MPEINITITNKVATVQGTPIIVCGNSDYTINFTFDADWDALTYKTARFVYIRFGKVLHEDRNFTGNVVEVPVLSNTQFVKVGVFGGDICTTTPAEIPCKNSILCNSGEPAIPTPEEDARIIALLSLAIDQQAAAEESANAAAASAAAAKETAASVKAIVAGNEAYTKKESDLRYDSIIQSASGTSIFINDSADRYLKGMTLYGKTEQDGTPTMDAPVYPKSAGDGGEINVSINDQTLVVETPNGLPGIPDDTYGNYTDSNGQKWYCDEIDFARGVYVKRVCKLVFDGTQESISSDAMDGYAYPIPDIIPQSVDEVAKVFCSHCLPMRYADMETGIYGISVLTNSDGENGVCITHETKMVDEDFLLAQYAAGTPVTVWYRLAEPIETALSEKQLAAFSVMCSYYPKTTVTNDEGCGMAVRYIADTKAYVDMITETEITLTDHPSYNTIIGSSAGTWGSGTDRVTYFVPVGEALQIDVTATSDANSIVALLKTDAHASGTVPDYATGGYRMTIPAGETVNLPVPEDCHYIAIMGLTKGVDYSPESVVFHVPVILRQWGQEIETEIKAQKTANKQNTEQIAKNAESIMELRDALYKKTAINLSESPSYNTIIGLSAGTWGSGTDRVTYFVPVGEALQIDVTATSDANSIVALLKTDAHASGTVPDYATGGYRMTIPAGETVNLPVPEDCHYIAIMGLTKGVDYSPESVVFHVPVIQERTATPPIGLHTMPDSEGVLNCIKRCRQLTDIKWTPMLDLPRWSSQDGGSTASGGIDVYEDVFEAGVEYTGIPYARADHGSSEYGYNNFFVGLNVDFGAFATAVREPNSIMKESVFSLSGKSAAMYGAVCSTLASYAYNISYRATASLAGVSGMEKIGALIVDGVRMDATLIKLGDMILDAGYHVGVVTDIMTDAEGAVAVIEVAEATTGGNGNLSKKGTQYGGLCRRKGWMMEEFFDHWQDYSVYRYAKIGSIPYTQSQYVNVGDEIPMMPKLDYACLPYMGEGFKYKAESIPNSTIIVCAGGFDYLRVMKDGEYFGNPIAINDETYVDAGFTEVGTYSAYLCNMDGDTEGKKTGSCHWSVV